MQQYEPQPVSRTYQYRKVMKPMLERKRRARINRCLDELKELMVSALQSDGENVAKLEKADILELTVRHLQRLSRESGGLATNNNLSPLNHNSQQQPQQPAVGQDRYSEGWASCLKEVAAYLGGGGLDPEAGLRLVSHLSRPRESQQPVWRPW